MPIVTISRESYTRAKDVAEKVAEKLGFQCVSREILIEASEEFNVPEVKLLQSPFAMHLLSWIDSPSGKKDTPRIYRSPCCSASRATKSSIMDWRATTSSRGSLTFSRSGSSATWKTA